MLGKQSHVWWSAMEHTIQEAQTRIGGKKYIYIYIKGKEDVLMLQNKWPSSFTKFVR